jgi:hypothetical protein
LLNTKENIRNRVAELQASAAERAEVTIESLINEAEAVRRAAMEAGVLAGKRVEHSERGVAGEFDDRRTRMDCRRCAAAP